ncbi:MAG TPA: FIST N-terminal domain-containing protein [Acidimicrobiia bacterium]|nr:FIST N-terminal domain-containing protein [Acidimicrobiia bacterium]
MFFAVVAHSDDIDAQAALDEIIEQCRGELGERTPKAGIVFCASDLEHDEILEGILNAWPDLELIGCTTDGEISSVLGYREDSVALVLFGSDTIEFAVGMGNDVSKDISSACRVAVESAAAKSDLAPALCITLPESLTASGLQIVESLVQQLGSSVPVVGAGAGDGHRLVATRQFCGREVGSDSVPVLLLSGPLVCSIALGSGWEPVGKPGLVTRSAGTLVEEIDGRPALEFYHRFLGETAEPTPEFPLAILDENGGVKYLRACLGVFDSETGTMTFVGEIPEGATVQMAVANREEILVGCTASIERAFAGYPEEKMPDVALFFSCASRKLLLGTRTMEEYGIIESIVGPDVPICGFYGYGEIGPRSSEGETSRFHNETFVSVILGT